MHKQRSKKKTVVVTSGDLQNRKKGENMIRTHKYTVFSFLPKMIQKEFNSFLNIYFLFICLVQIIRLFRVIPLLSTWVPFVVVLAVSMIQELYEDYMRYRQDKKVNSEQIRIMKHGKILVVKSKDIQPGDILVVHDGDRIPADCVILKTYENSRIVFNKTDQLDGETDWKIKTTTSIFNHLEKYEDVTHMDIHVTTKEPIQDIYSFCGSIAYLEDGVEKKKEMLSIDNVLWMNTEFVSSSALVFVIFVGRRTQSSLSMTKPRSKTGWIDAELNKHIVIISIGVVIVSVFYTMMQTKKDFVTCLIFFFKYLIMFSSIIPISIRVTIEIARKFVYKYKIQNDKDIEGTILRNSNVIEDAGKIAYFFTDKTGTLTRNIMSMKKIHLGSICYATELNTDIMKILEDEAKQIGINDSVFRKNTNTIEGKIRRLTMALSVCHNVILTERGGSNYKASSPDEIAIVQWLRDVNVKLILRSNDEIIVEDSDGKANVFTIVHNFPFQSEKKRMGILVRENKTNKIFFIVKGADSEILKITKENDWVEETATTLAQEGLRTLVVALREIDRAVFEKFLEKRKRMMRLEDGKEESAAAAALGVLEFEMDVAGVIGVEDELQDNVLLTLESIKNAGIKVWMLTGDKIDTARSIALSTNIIPRRSKVLTIEKKTRRRDVYEIIARAEREKYFYMIIDGDSLNSMMKWYFERFIALATDMKTVVCTRCTPLQKSQVVKAVKEMTKRCVCAIGDGGNDVSMIRVSNLGIGLEGREGCQASLSADISIRKFSYVKKIFFWHGRNTYRSTTKLASFMIHRGMIISTIQGIFSAIFNLVPIMMYQGNLLIGYSTVYTWFPILAIAWSEDTTPTTALIYPEIYSELSIDYEYSLVKLVQWLIISMYQGAMIIWMSMVIDHNNMSYLITVTFTSLILNEMALVFFTINRKYKIALIGAGASFSLYILSFVVFKNDLQIAYSIHTFMMHVSIVLFCSLFVPCVIYIYKRFLSVPNYTKLNIGQ